MSHRNQLKLKFVKSGAIQKRNTNTTADTNKNALFYNNSRVTNFYLGNANKRKKIISLVPKKFRPIF
jgi:hypothetical protein